MISRKLDLAIRVGPFASDHHSRALHVTRNDTIAPAIPPSDGIGTLGPGQREGRLVRATVAAAAPATIARRPNAPPLPGARNAA